MNVNLWLGDRIAELYLAVVVMEFQQALYLMKFQCLQPPDKILHV